MATGGPDPLPDEPHRDPVRRHCAMIQPDEIGTRVKRLRVIWLALLFGVATFYLVVWFILKRGGLEGASRPPGLLPAAAIVAIALLFAPLVRRRLEAFRRGASADEIARRWELGWIVGQTIKEVQRDSQGSINILHIHPAAY